MTKMKRSPMTTQPLHQVLAQVAEAIAAGLPVKPYGATYDGRDIVTVTTKRGPAAFHLRDLETIRAANLRKAQDKRAKLSPVPVAVAAAPVPLPAAPAKRPAELARRPQWLPLEKTWAYLDWSRKARPGKAPRRSVGNFTTDESTARTLAALAHNVRQARESGHQPLIRAMEAAMADALVLAKGGKEAAKIRKA